MTVDPRAALPVNTVLERKEPKNGDPWSRLVVVGYADFDGGAVTEIVVRPVEGFDEAAHVSLEALDDLFEVVAEGEAPKPWQSDPLDVLLRRDPSQTPIPADLFRSSADEPTEPVSDRVKAAKES